MTHIIETLYSPWKSSENFIQIVTFPIVSFLPTIVDWGVTFRCMYEYKFGFIIILKGLLSI